VSFNDDIFPAVKNNRRVVPQPCLAYLKSCRSRVSSVR
jgi:hypothetical protein